MLVTNQRNIVPARVESASLASRLLPKKTSNFAPRVACPRRNLARLRALSRARVACRPQGGAAAPCNPLRPAQPSPARNRPPPPTMSTTTAEPGAGTRHARRAPSQGPSPPPTRRQKTWISWVTAALIARCFLHFPFNRPPVPPSLSSSLLFSSCSSSFLHFDLLNHHSSSMVCCC